MSRKPPSRELLKPRRGTGVRDRWAYVFLFPFIAGMALFFAWPLARSGWMSLQRGAGTDEARFAGLANYSFAARDPLLWGSLLNTLAFAALFLVVQIPASLGLALLLNDRRTRGLRELRFIFFSTHLVGVVFAAVLFSDMLSGRHSLMSRLLLHAGLIDIPLDLLNREAWVMPLMLACAWYLSVGFGMIYCLAALQHVDRQLYDAALMDGAGAWGRLFHVTIPQIRPTLSFLAIAGAIWALQVFELPYVLLDGPGPNYRGLTAVMYLFAIGFERGDLGYSAAIGWIFTVVVVLITLAMIRMLGVGREEVES